MSLANVDRRGFLLGFSAALLTACNRTKEAAGAAPETTEASASPDLVAAIGLAIVPSFSGDESQTVLAILNGSLPENDMRLCLAGLEALDQACFARFGARFANIEPSLRSQIVAWLDVDVNSPGKGDAQPGAIQSRRFFEIMKSMILVAHFTSEKAASSELSYDPVPGQFNPNVVVDRDFRNDVFDRGSVYFLPAPRWNQP